MSNKRAREAKSRLTEEQAQYAFLLNLPVELTEWVGEYLLPTDLLSLRLACRELEAKTKRLTARVCFKTRSFMLASKASMRTLLDISEHEIFSRSLTTVRLYLVALPDSNDDRKMRRDEQRLGPCPPHTREGRVLQRHGRREYERLAKEEREYRSFQNVVDLQIILGNFEDAGNIPSIVAVGDKLSTRTPGPKPWGFRRLCESLGYDGLYGQWHYSHPYKIIKQAISESGFPITDLTMGSKDSDAPLCMFTYKSKLDAYRNLRSLQLTIGSFGPFCTHPKHSAIYETIVSTLDCWYSFLMEARQLETLSLIMNHMGLHLGFNGSVFRTLAGVKMDGIKILPRLRNLKLERHAIVPDVLCQFVRERRSTLKSLDLRYITDEGPVLHSDAYHPDIMGNLREACGSADTELRLKHVYDRKASLGIL